MGSERRLAFCLSLILQFFIVGRNLNVSLVHRLDNITIKTKRNESDQ